MTESLIDVAGRAPHPWLRSYVEGYLGYRMEGFAPGIHRGLPGRHLTFIVSLADAVQVATMPDPAYRPRSFPAFVAGLTAGPATIVHDGSQHGISIDLTPFGARSLFGMPAAELAGSVVELDTVIGRLAPQSHLLDRLLAAPTWVDCFAILDEVLITLAGSQRPAPPLRAEVTEAWRRLVRSGGTAEIGPLAADLGWSRRHLGERFRAEIGLSPKALARVVRFERSRRLLARPGRPRLATVAAEAGYYDQAHLTRDWRELAGCTPTTWLREELPPVQDPHDGPGAR